MQQGHGSVGQDLSGAFLLQKCEKAGGIGFQSVFALRGYF